MSTNENITLKLHQSLGQLFYAIAAVDNTVREEEIISTQKWIEKYWKTQEIIENPAKNKPEHTIMDTFKTLYKNKDNNPENCFYGFVNFKKENESIFTNHIRTLILKTASKIANSFSGKNKSELILLAKLTIELKKGRT